MFRTIADVDEYLSGDSVECLVCGRLFRNLTKHLQMLHSVDPREYRIQYGIPLSWSLVGATTRALHANAALKQTETLEKLLAAGKSRGSAAGVAKRQTQGMSWLRVSVCSAWLYWRAASLRAKRR